MSLAAPTPISTGETARGSVRIRAPAIQSRTVAGLTAAFAAPGRPLRPPRGPRARGGPLGFLVVAEEDFTGFILTMLFHEALHDVLAGE